MEVEQVIEVLWRRLRPFISDASVDQADGAIQAVAEEICGWYHPIPREHELTEECWCNPRVLAVEGVN